MTDARNEPEGKDEKLAPGDLDKLLAAMAKAREETDFEFPILVTEIQKKGRFLGENPMCSCGTLVKIRPVPKKDDEKPKTYLGIYIGDIATDLFTLFADDETKLTTPKSGVLTLLVGRNNPAIFVPALRRVVFGYESWWGPIDDPAEAEKMISDEDIANVPYVKALRAMAAAEAAEGDDADA